MAAIFYGHIENFDMAFTVPNQSYPSLWGKQDEGWVIFKELPPVPYRISELWFWVTEYLNRNILPVAPGVLSEQPLPFIKALHIASAIDAVFRKRKKDREEELDYG